MAGAHHTPSPARAQGSSGESIIGTIRGTMAQGIGIGAGFEIAERLVTAILGPRTIRSETVVVSEATKAKQSTENSVGRSDPCSNHSKAFQDCFKHYGSDIGKCQFYLDMLSECSKNSGSKLSVEVIMTPTP